MPFRLLSSVADVTAGSAELISRIVASVGHPHSSVADLEPRLSRAMTWTSRLRARRPTAPPSGPRPTPRGCRPDRGRAALAAPAARPAARRPDLDATTALVYGVPKLARGLGLDDEPTDEVKADQKDFFRLLYNLLVDADRGPRLPTLFLALGAEKVRSLLTPPPA